MPSLMFSFFNAPKGTQHRNVDSDNGFIIPSFTHHVPQKVGRKQTTVHHDKQTNKQTKSHDQTYLWCTDLFSIIPVFRSDPPHIFSIRCIFTVLFCVSVLFH